MLLISTIKNWLFHQKLKRATGLERAEMFRNRFHFLGQNVELHTMYIGSEPYLISIHDNVVCAQDVKFITHDISCFRVANYLGIPHNKVDKVGKIVLYENCFVGAYSILMPNCSVGKNSIVAAGSLVTKHIPDGEVWGGVPAKFIMTIDEYSKRVVSKSMEYPWMENKDNLSKKEIIRMRENFFFADEC